MHQRTTPWTLAGEESLRLLPEGERPRVSVVIPARDEAATIGGVLDAVKSGNDWFDELVVIDDHSSDDTATVASSHGATVIPSHGSGKGAALATGVNATTGAILLFLDGDVTNTREDVVARMIAPLLADDSVMLVKAFYERPLHDMPTGGGRVTELAARPILSLLYPGLGEIRQPLAGETALRREALSALSLSVDYAVEIGLLLDVATAYGPGALAQVDLGVRRHRNRPLQELHPMAVQILRAALERRGLV
jgi:glucosyl-3-phosphoglycerate synthase